ncbi:MULTISPECIES: YusW family protein [Sporosarcina]|uniref:YusW family protein n=1 Tax=Sporosarcina TaxID=1569 RepID=UPI0005911F73|nr:MULTISPECIES: YusW family protein [Sporosarcina]WJY26921.1 YusW family protein [Sporosarcina sp. 0.2-SM1T-5]
MKPTAAAGSVLALSLLLGACGSTDDDKATDTTGTEDTATEPGSVNDTDTGMDDAGTDSEDGSTGTETDTSGTSDSSDTAADGQDDMKEKMDQLAYDEFELEVDYGKDQEYEIEIEQDNGVVEAKVEDELSNQNLNGQEAFDEIYPKLKELTITETTSKEDAIQQALDAFGLKDDYVKFDMEITMPDGKKLTFEDKK